MTGPSNPLSDVSTHALASFIPQLAAERPAADPVSPIGPRSDQFSAALLQCDLSGFTSVAEKLAQRGPAGVEELSRSLSAIFGHLTQTAAERGGDVVEFAGDALLIVWAVSDNAEVTLAVRRAADCSCQLQPMKICCHTFLVPLGSGSPPARRPGLENFAGSALCLLTFLPLPQARLWMLHRRWSGNCKPSSSTLKAASTS